MGVFDQLVPRFDDIKHHRWREGVVDPNGIFYGCGYSGHNDLLWDLQRLGLIDNNIDCFSESGWLKLTSSWFNENDFFYFRGDHKISKQQIQAMIDYAESREMQEICLNSRWILVEEFKQVLENMEVVNNLEDWLFDGKRPNQPVFSDTIRKSYNY